VFATTDGYGRFALILFLAAAATFGGLAGYLIGTRPDAGLATSVTDPLLDGRVELDGGRLAELARERAAMGARWLAGVARDDGSFLYEYHPEDDSYDREDYNEVRHAGTTYSLFTAYGVEHDPDVLDAAEGGAGYIDASSLNLGERGRAYVYGERMKLGGQALAIVALLERRRVLEDTSHDDLIDGLARFMASLELSDEPGRYYQSYYHQEDRPSLDPDSDYYPGEALLAFTRLAQQFPDGPYLEHARRAAQFLIYQRDGDIPAAQAVPRQDHWLTMALSELYRLDPRPEYLEVAFLQADGMVASQHGADALPMRIGGSALQSPINHTSTATKAEALVAAWALARFAGDDAAEARFASAGRRNLQFQLRVQYTADNTQLFPRPDAAIGAWGKDAVDPWIRIDFVQHNISGLLAMWSMTTTGDVPIAEEQ
jgi:hypothetical protein